MKKRFVVPVVAGLIASNLLTYHIAIERATHGLSGVDFARISNLESTIDKYYLGDVDKKAYMTGIMKGIVSSLGDPYSEYMTKEEYARLSEMTTGSFFGIGVVIGPGEHNLITIISPIKGSPADEAGLKSGDQILAVDGEEFTADAMQGAVAKMKGAKGTEVQLKVLTKQGAQKTLRLKRDEIHVNSVESQKIGDLGYIAILEFKERTGEEFKTALQELRNQSVKGLVLDLRGNPGGVVDAAVSIADVLLPEGTIVTSKDKEGKELDHAVSDAEELGLPLAVLINGGSASASEILAGAIRDFHAGILVGEKTFGKGVIQVVQPLPEGEALKLTIAQYFTPSGENIHKKGIAPDVEVTLPEGTQGVGPKFLEEDLQLQRAINLVHERLSDV